MRKRNQKDQSSNHSRAGKKQLVGKNLSTLALNLPPNGLPPSLGCPSSGSWTSSGRSSQWRSRSWWLGPQTAEWVSPLYFWLPGVIHFVMVLKIDMFKSTATCSGLAKVAASHFRTFLDWNGKWGHGKGEGKFNWKLFRLIKEWVTSSGTASSSSSPRSSSTLLLGRNPQYSDYCDTIFYVLHLTKESSVPYG